MNKLFSNLNKIIELYINNIDIILNKKSIDLDPFNFSSVLKEFYKKITEDPEKLGNWQFKYFQNYLDIIKNIEQRYNNASVKPIYDLEKKDIRFRDQAWNDNIYFNFFKQLHVMNHSVSKDMVCDYVGNDNSRKILFHLNHILNIFSPTNFILTNPEVLNLTIETQGENLIQGLENLKKDLENSKNFLQIKTYNENYILGKDLAATKGKVVYQNDLMQLIKYDNVVSSIYSRPLLMIPPWINKYYILDLNEKNSFIKWLTEQGFSVFIISWVNPSIQHKDKDFENYMLQGVIESLDFITEHTNFKKVNVIGYCLGGTLLVCALSYMSKMGINKVSSATFLTSLIDFSNAGELLYFIDDDKIDMLEKIMDEDGFYSGTDMAMTFNMLKPNEMIWHFFVNNYLLGKEIDKFDLLYWNSDSTRLPYKMHSFYLRNMYQNNLLIKPNGIVLNNISIDVSNIKIPCYFLSTIDDHIAPWIATYDSLYKFSDKRFTLTSSGHVAGVINHPNSNKYCYWINDKTDISSDEWLISANEKKGSWWLDWIIWQKKYSGRKIKDKNTDLPFIEDAPGSYVRIT